MTYLKIAYLSFEFPPDTAIGGIATYTEHIAKLMAARGHLVEVFTSTPKQESLNEEVAPNLIVHRIATSDRNVFYKTLLSFFKQRQELINFDLVESPDYQREGLAIKKEYPQLPMIIRFHTPSFFIKELNKKFTAHTTKEKLKKILGIKQYKKEKDPEFELAKLCEGWSVPSLVMKDVLIQYWQAVPDKIKVLANPFQPSKNLLSINEETATETITYIGRLEIRKGVTQLTKAIPFVLERYPKAKFRFIGKSDHGPHKAKLMIDFMKDELKEYTSQLEFINHVSKAEIETYLAQTDICVFPSLWEVFGYVCVEAMASARGIVASKHGGMKDMLEGINGGILVDPFEPQQIADGILYLLTHPKERIEMAHRSRVKAAGYYSNQLIDETENYYRGFL